MILAVPVLTDVSRLGTQPELAITLPAPTGPYTFYDVVVRASDDGTPMDEEIMEASEGLSARRDLMTTISSYMVAFLDQELKGKTTALLSNPAADSARVRLRLIPPLER